MSDRERLKALDRAFYDAQIAPVLPPVVLDFHTHLWRRDQWKTVPWEADSPGGRYMVTDQEYTSESLLDDGRRLFPDRTYQAVCFGQPTPAVDRDKTNAYVAATGRIEGLFPLLIVGRDEMPPHQIERRVLTEGFFGYKVFLNWYGDDYGSVTPADMLGPAEMAVADKLGLIVLWHVPRARRLADPAVQQGIREYAQRYPNARLVLAHCGRCYLPEEMAEALPAMRDLPNVYFDTAMVMDPVALQLAFKALGPERIVFATDLPVAAMRGRRVQVMDHWVDVVLPGYAPSAYRVSDEGIRACPMVYEIIRAVAWGAKMAGLSPAQTAAVFYQNGRSLLDHALAGRGLSRFSGNDAKRWPENGTVPLR